MDDGQILSEIHDLVAEEKRLRADGEPSDADRQRLVTVEQQLDQCWDLLRQRRAREEVGADPDAAQPRPIPEVESYEQ
jgi:hypothetical protein